MITTLDNGMTVAVQEDHNAPVVALRLYVRAGSLYEQEFMGSGISHFFEHLLSGGSTARRTEEQAKELVASIGGQVNAYTTCDHTCYHINTRAQHFDVALELLSDWVVRHQFQTDEFQRERDVIVEEMVNRESNPGVQLHRLLHETVFKTHPARFPVIGYRDLFLKITEQDLQTYYRRMYVPNNILFVAVGDFRASEAFDKARKQFADLKPGNIPVLSLPTEPEQMSRRFAVKEMDVAKAYAEMAYRTVKLDHPDVYPLDVLSNILSAGDSSRLVQELREKRRLVFAVHTGSHTPGYDAGVFSVGAVLEPDKVDAFEKAATGELERVQREAVTEAELGKAKKQVSAGRWFDMETAAERASDLGQNLISAMDADYTRTYVERIQRVTAEDIQRVARQYFRPDRLTVAVVRPPAAKAAEEAGGKAQTGRIVKTVLPNGLRLLVKRSPRLPIVAMCAGFMAGVRAETPADNGIGHFVANMLTRGTRTRTAVQIADAFDAIGGAFGVSSGNNSFYLTARCLKEDLPTAMDIVADCVKEPSFDPAEIEQERRLTLAGLERRQDDWRTLLNDRFRERFFRESPYRMIPEGSPETVKRFQRDDLVRYHQRCVVANNMVLAVFGDVDEAEARRMVEERFGSMHQAPDFRPPSPPAEKPLERTDAVTLPRQKRNLGTVFVGYSGLRVQDRQDRYVMDVIDAITSGVGVPSGWLHHALRGDKQGLVYEVHAFHVPGVDPGYFGAYAACKPDHVQEVAETIRRQIARALDDAIEQKDLDTAKETCVTARQLGDQTAGAQAMEAVLDELYGLGYDASERYAEGIRSVTVEDIRRVARKHLAHSLTVVVVPAQGVKAE